MELLEYLSIIKKRLWMILAITILCTAASSAVSIFVMDKIYEGKVTLIIGRNQSIETEKVRYDDILMYQKLVKTYGELVKSRLVVDETLSRLKYDLTYEDMEQKLKVTPRADTQILEISVEDSNAERAVQLANTLTSVFIEQVKLIMSSNDAKIMDKAHLPKKPVKPRVVLNIVMALIAGLAFSLGLAFLIEYLDNTLKDNCDIEEHLGMTVLANIPYIQGKKK